MGKPLQRRYSLALLNWLHYYSTGAETKGSRGRGRGEVRPRTATVVAACAAADGRRGAIGCLEVPFLSVGPSEPIPSDPIPSVQTGTCVSCDGGEKLGSK